MISQRPIKLALFFFILFIVACQKITDNPSEVSTLDNDIVQQLDSIGQYFIEEGKTMGLSIAVAKKDQIVYNKGFGFTDEGKSNPVQNDHIFLLASVSKLIGAAMTMKLIDEGKLSLEDTLSNLLPDFPNQEQAEKIQLKHLLAHTSGLKDYASVIDSIYLTTRIDPTEADYYQFFENAGLDFEPGTHFNYSNSGFILMAMIIERVTGHSFEEELDRIINQPAGLNLKLIGQRIGHPKLSNYFELEDAELVQRPHWPWIKGDGGLTTTAQDLVLFPYHWANGTIISKDSYEKMIKPFKLKDGLSTGYGLGVRTGLFEGVKAIGHTGGNKSGYAVMKYLPEEETSIVVFLNTDNTPSDALYIEGYIALALLGKKVPDLERLEIKAEDLSRFTGEYQAINNFYYGSGTLSIVQHEDDFHLYRKRTGSSSRGQKLFYLGNNTFGYEPYAMDRVVFSTNENGEVIAFKTYWNGLKKGGFYRKIIPVEQ